MKNIILIADFFVEDGINGGAELYTGELISLLKKNQYEVEKLKSQNVNIETLNENNFYIISNFMFLTEQVKNKLIDLRNYIIIEHDAKFCKSNNPVLYKNLVLPEKEIQNKKFFESAKAVLCQSKLHAETLQKNLLLKNIINLGCNLWSDENIELLRKNLNKNKTRKFGVMDSSNKNKGTPQTIEYCRNNNIQFELIPAQKQEHFYEELAKTETLVFFPQWLESYCRVVVEARILGCKIITNKVVGSTSESYFNIFKGEELLNFIEFRKQSIIQTYINLIENIPVVFMNPFTLPKVSVITTLYKGGEHIRGYIEAFLKQTIASDSELIIVDANSPEDEMEIASEYMEVNPNIKYVRLNEKLTPMDCFNLATKKYATGELISCVLIDDRMSEDYLETLAKHLTLNPNIDLVYGDCLQTTKPNETVEQNSSKGRMYEHSRNDFSKENMIKCLPGPMPMYRKNIHEKYGYWNEKLKHAGDWELWLRCVRNGSEFKKVDKVIGLYYFNPNGLSTSPEHMTPRRIEERDVFNEYKDVIGDKNYNLFKDYFNSI